MATILVVDDSRFTRLKISSFLQENGHEVIEAENGKSGLDLVRSQKPDCIVTDLLMPEMDGYAVLQAMQEENINIPVIVITADIQATTRQRVMDLGAFAVMNKPANSNEISEQIQAAIESESKQP